VGEAPNELSDGGLVDKLAKSVGDASDSYRESLPSDYEKTKYDIEVGMAKGTYAVGKRLVTGVIDLASFSAKLLRGDTEAWTKTSETLWSVAKFAGKSLYHTYLASPEEQMKFNAEMNQHLVNMYDAAKKKVIGDWEEAKKTGKEGELIANWGTQGILEVAMLFIGVGEAKAAVSAGQAGKLMEGVEVAKAAEVSCDAGKAAAAADAAKAEKVIQAAKAVEHAPPRTAPLRFGSDDLVYGPSAGGKLRRLQQEAGGKLLTDLEKPFDKSWGQFTRDTLENAAASERQVHFDLSHMKDMDNVLAGEGKFGESVTAEELRHIRDNWDKFKVKPKFYMDGREVPPPWLK
jgi:hypothetical protein